MDEAQQIRKYVNLFYGKVIPIDSFIFRNFAIRAVTVELFKLKPCICFVFELQIINYLLTAASVARAVLGDIALVAFVPTSLRLLCTATASGQRFPVRPSCSVKS